MLEKYSLEQFMYDKEESLMEKWDYYKYEEHSDLFHYDDVDFFDEDLYAEMCEKEYHAYMEAMCERPC